MIMGSKATPPHVVVAVLLLLVHEPPAAALEDVAVGILLLASDTESRTSTAEVSARKVDL